MGRRADVFFAAIRAAADAFTADKCIVAAFLHAGIDHIYHLLLVSYRIYCPINLSVAGGEKK